MFPEVLKPFYYTLRRKRLHYWKRDDWPLHYDNTPMYSLNLGQQFLSKTSHAQIREPPYSPDIAPCDLGEFEFSVLTVF